MPGVPANEITASDFMMVRAALVKRLGSANNALVWTRIHWRCSTDSAHTVTDDDGTWWPVNRDELGDETGLSGDQVKRSLGQLLDKGYLVEREHRQGGNYDRTRSYMPVVRNHPIDRAESPSESGGIAQSDRAKSPSVPISKDLDTKTENVGGAASAPILAVVDSWQVLCHALADRIEANGSKRPTVTKKWLDAARLMVERDGRSIAQVSNMINWSQDSSFWRANILSMPTLREKYDQMRLQAMRDAEAATSSVVDAGRMLFEHYREQEAAASTKERDPEWKSQKSLSS